MEEGVLSEEEQVEAVGPGCRVEEQFPHALWHFRRILGLQSAPASQRLERQFKHNTETTGLFQIPSRTFCNRLCHLLCFTVLLQCILLGQILIYLPGVYRGLPHIVNFYEGSAKPTLPGLQQQVLSIMH